MGNANIKPHPKPRNKKQIRWKAAVRPSPPGKPSLLQENGILLPDVVHISWSKPEKDGGSAILAYMVEHRKVGTPHWVKASPLPVLETELIVSGLDPGWRYQFRLFAENAVGISDPSEISEPITVTLHRSSIAAPKFTQELKDSVVLEQSKVEFEVHFLGQPSPCICWFKDSFEIFGSNRIRITTVANKSVLTILQSNAGDEGEIKCTATNKAGHTATRAKLVIESPPSIRLPKSYHDQDGLLFEIGETIKFNVAVGGRPTPLVFWSHDGESIQNDDRHEIEYSDRTATVKIENAGRLDRGEYQIKAVNKLGHEETSFLVTITDKPTPPGRARVVLTSGRSVTLSWSTPEDDGGCRIGNYIIEYYRVGWNVWLKAATSRQLSTMLGDLIEGSQYKFRVKAESPYGVSDPSEESETVFIPDYKRGINNPTDAINRIEQDSKIPFDVTKRKRASSSPRVSFTINEDMPIRPERRKTGKTPEASPRFKRKQILTTSSRENMSSGANIFLRRSSLPYVPLSSESSPRMLIKQEDRHLPLTLEASPRMKRKQDDRHDPLSLETSPKMKGEQDGRHIPLTLEASPRMKRRQEDHFSDKKPISEYSSSKLLSAELSYDQKEKNFFNSKSEIREESRKGSPNSPLVRQLAFTFPEVMIPSPLNTKSKTPSPEIIITDHTSYLDTTLTEKVSKSPDRNVVKRKRSFSESATDKKTAIDLQTSMKSQELVSDDKIFSSNNERIRPTLTHQNFSGSSEFMLVLCPEGEQGTHMQKFEMEFDQHSVPPPLSLSAPELGTEPPEQAVLKRSASSSELLLFRLMERINEALLEQETEIDSRRSEHHERPLDLEIPTIQVNSKSPQEIVGLTNLPTFNRRSSFGSTSTKTPKWSQRRHSLRNTAEYSNLLEANLSKSKESAENIKRELYDIQEQIKSQNERTLASKIPDNDEEWMKDYEDSITSEEDTESSMNEDRSTSISPFYPNDVDEEEGTYNPSNRIITSATTDINRPFEILTIRKDPPDSNIVPKPILKKKPEFDTNLNVIKNNSGIKAKQLIDNNSPKPLSVNRNKIDSNNKKGRQERSTSLIGPSDDRLDIRQIKKSPNNMRRRSFSFLQSQQASKSDTASVKPKPLPNVSALANYSSIAGTSVIIPENNNMMNKKASDEEAKVVVDFYGDIVRNFGGRTKPTAEFSTTVGPKYDSYEERKISEIKPNRDLSPLDKSRVSEHEGDIKKLTNYSSNNSNIKLDVMDSKSSIVRDKDVRVAAPVQVPKNKESSFIPYNSQLENVSRGVIRTSPVKDGRYRTPSKSPIRHSPLPTSSNNKKRSSSPSENLGRGMYQRQRHTPERPQSRSVSVTRRAKVPHSRDASTSPVRFENWEGRTSSRSSLEREYYGKGSLNSSRASSLSRRSLSPPRPKLREITTQTSFRIEPKTIADVLRKQEELATTAERRMKGVFEYFTDLAMVGVACWLYFFKNEYLAIPVLLILVYRQLSEEMSKMKLAITNRIPNWLKRRFRRAGNET